LLCTSTSPRSPHHHPTAPPRPPTSPPFPYTPLFRSHRHRARQRDGTNSSADRPYRLAGGAGRSACLSIRYDKRIARHHQQGDTADRKSTRLNSSHVSISYAVFCLKKKKKKTTEQKQS